MSDDAATPQRSDLRSVLSRLAVNAVGLVHTRVELASIELAEERERIIASLVAIAVAILLFAFGLLTATLGVIAWFWDTNRYAAIAVVTLLYVICGALAWRRFAALRRGAPTPFAATLNEFDKDRRSLTGAATEATAKASKP